LMRAKDARVAEQMAGNRYVGIHITLGMDDKEKRPMIPSVFPGGPAGRAGIKDGAIIEEIDGADTKGMKLREAVDRLRGDEGTDVTVKIRQLKETKSLTLKITRGQLPRPTFVGFGASPSHEGKLRLDVPDPIGYLRITELTASTPHELRKLAQRMESAGTRALVLDLRGIRSGGSAVHSAVLLADSLLERGTIGRVRTARGETTYQADADALFRGWPIAVLVDQNTSGTAEWLAAALQDNHRAVIVGSPTSGAHRRRLVAPGVSPMEDAWPLADEAIVKATVPVGDGRWSISMATGTLERGDGRPLADRVGTTPGDSAEQERPKGGVQPDHSSPAFRAPVQARRMPTEKADPYTKSAEKSDRSNDWSLDAAVTILHQALVKP
jgi:C-terminal peptidase prc